MSAGQVVAACGDTGNASEPHLHIQVTDSPHVSIAVGLPMGFVGAEIDGAEGPALPANDRSDAGLVSDRVPAPAQRTVTPDPRIASLTSPTVRSPKWNTLAASTASAPASTAGAKSAAFPAPPLATIGT